MTDQNEDARWSREDVQRVLFHIVKAYEQAQSPDYTQIKGRRARDRKTPRRFVLFGRRPPTLGGDSELLRDAIRVGRETLKDNQWWPA